nr:hypothetical protein [Tanacetum cinerariifolium]
MTSLFAESHNMVAILEKSDAAEGFEQIIDFLSGSYINHALTVNPHVYISCIKQFWNTVVVKRSEIFAGLARMGYEKPSTKLTFYEAFFSTQWKFFIHIILHSLSAKRTSWNEFSSAMASALICLSSEEVATNVIPPTPTSPSPSSPVIPSSPPHQPPCPPQPQDAEGSSLLFQRVLDTCSTLARRVEDDVENVFNQGRIIVDMDQDEGIELVADQKKDAKKDTEVEGRHADKQAEIYNIDLDHSSKVLSMQEDDTEEEINKEHKESYKNIDWNAALDHVQSKEPQYIKRYHGMKKKPQTKFEARKNMIFYLKKTEEDKEIIKSINETPAQKAAKRRKLHKQAKEDEDLKKQLEVVVDEDDDVFIEATPIGRKRYPLSMFTLEQLVNMVRLKVKEESEMLLELLRFTRQQLQEYQQG